jgi:hypothetical protein
VGQRVRGMDMRSTTVHGLNTGLGSGEFSPSEAVGFGTLPCLIVSKQVCMFRKKRVYDEVGGGDSPPPVHPVATPLMLYRGVPLF